MKVTGDLLQFTFSKEDESTNGQDNFKGNKIFTVNSNKEGGRGNNNGNVVIAGKENSDDSSAPFSL